MEKNEVIKLLIEKVFLNKKKNVLSSKEIKFVEDYYKANYLKFETFEMLLESNDTFKKLVNRLKSGKMALEKQFKLKKGLQPGIIAECVFAQTLAEILNLDKCVDFYTTVVKEVPKELHGTINNLRSSASTWCAARFAYYQSGNLNDTIYQYGDPTAIADIAVILSNIEIIIEVKDMPALIGDKDLEYDEEGHLLITEEINKDYPEYVDFINTFNNKTNIFDEFGSNYTLFDKDPEKANSFLSTFLNITNMDVLLTSIDDEIVLIKKEDISAKFEDGTYLISTKGSEIRTTGKNPKKVFTPKYLDKVLKDFNISVNEGICKVEKTNKDICGFKQGRTSGKITRFKISSCFFVRTENVAEDENFYIFKKEDILQCKSGISIHVNLNKTKEEIKNFYIK